MKFGMCYVRIIIRGYNNNVVSDSMEEFDTDLKPIERPAYIEYIVNEERVKLIFHYTGSTEKYVNSTYKNLRIVYGEVSGRMKEVVIEGKQLFDTDEFNLLQQLNNKPNTLRFTENLQYGFHLVKLILKRFVEK